MKYVSLPSWVPTCCLNEASSLNVAVAFHMGEIVLVFTAIKLISQ